MKRNLKDLEEIFAATIIWPVLIFGVFKLLTDVLHFPLEWYTIIIAFVLTIYLGIKVGIGERI